MKIALLCSGLGRVHRGHEVFARGLFDLVSPDLDMTLLKGAGPESPREHVVPHIPRDSVLLDGMSLPVSPKWKAAAEEVERMRVEGETFAYAALHRLLDGQYDILHCLEQEVCQVLYGHRHLFARPPRILWSNGGAIPAAEIPPCDFVQEHTDGNLRQSIQGKAFMIPHGVDTQRFRPGVATDFRQRHGIPADAFLVISVGTICYWHKRMDHVINEVAQVPGAWLLIVGQEGPDSPAIKALGRQKLGDRVVFTTVPHADLPQAYAAADVFALGSLFETFGIVYIEAMAMGLPVVCTNHPNQRSIVKEGLFIDMARPGALADVLRSTPRETLQALGARGVQIARQHYDLQQLKQQYLQHYARIAATPVELPRANFRRKLAANARNAWRRVRHAVTT